MTKMPPFSFIVIFLVLILVVTWGSSVVGAASGKVVYDRTCSPCHGATGRGDGRSAALFQPTKPQNFTDPAFWQGNVDQKISRNVMGFGKKMGKMELDPDEITAVTAYITQQFKPK
jgi:mono/diheme cytochrome c family protein